MLKFSNNLIDFSYITYLINWFKNLADNSNLDISTVSSNLKCQRSSRYFKFLLYIGLRRRLNKTFITLPEKYLFNEYDL